MAGSLRTALAATIATLLMLILHVPGMMYGVFLIFLVSYETAYLTFKRGLVAICVQSFGAASALCLISVTGDSPVAKVIGVAICAFVAAFIRVTEVRFIIQPLDFSVFAIATIFYFDSGMRANQAVSMSLWPVAGGAIGVGCKVAIEYIFTRRMPYHDLHREIDARYLELEKIFQLYGSNCATPELQTQIIRVRNYAFMGQGKMQHLLQEINERHRKETPRKVVPASIPVLAMLMDLMAGYAVHNVPADLSTADRALMNDFVQAMKFIQEGKWEEAWKQLDGCSPASSVELAQIENGLRTLVAFYLNDSHDSANASAHAMQLATGNQHWLVPDCFSNPEYALYAFKVSLCAALCNVIYNAMAWPGIATAVTTVLVAGLSTSGASNQKLIYRLIGSTLGGVICGLGCIIFVYPNADSAVPFLLSIALVTWIAAWVSRSPHFGYIGLQIAFSFYMTVLTDFSAPTQITPARDRLVGIMLAILVMLFVFRFEKGADKMQQTFARLLRLQSDYLLATVADLPDPVRQRKVMELKEQMGLAIGSARGFAELVPFEFSPHREVHVLRCEKIEQAIWRAGDLVLSVSSWPPNAVSADCARQARTAIVERLPVLAEAIEQQGHTHGKPLQKDVELCAAAPGAVPPYVDKSLAIYKELYLQCAEIAPA